MAPHIFHESAVIPWQFVVCWLHSFIQWNNIYVSSILYTYIIYIYRWYIYIYNHCIIYISSILYIIYIYISSIYHLYVYILYQSILGCYGCHQPRLLKPWPLPLGLVAWRPQRWDGQNIEPNRSKIWRMGWILIWKYGWIWIWRYGYGYDSWLVVSTPLKHMNVNWDDVRNPILMGK